MDAAAIITALRARATAAGYTVVLYRQVDEEDVVPVVVIAGHQEAREVDPETHGLVYRLLDINVYLVAEAETDDHAIEALQAAETLSAELVRVTPDVADTIVHGVTFEVIEQNVEMRTSSTDAIIVELLIRAAYTGES